MLPLVGPAASSQSTSFVPLTSTRLGCAVAAKTYVPVVGASIQPVRVSPNARPSAAAEVSEGSQLSAAAAHWSLQAETQQSPSPPFAHTAAAQVLHALESAVP